MLSTVEIKLLCPTLSTQPLEAFLLSHPAQHYRVERKIDGERMFCLVKGSDVVFTNRHVFTGTLPTIGEQMLKCTRVDEAIFDGELAGEGRFYEANGFIQNRAHRDALTFNVFDLISLNGTDLREWPHEERYVKLLELLRPDGKVQLAEGTAVKTQPEIEAYFKQLTDRGEEGVVVKPSNSIYADHSQLKMKKFWTVDVVILGIRKTKGFLENGIPESFLVGYYNPITKTYKPVTYVASGLTLNVKHTLGMSLLEHQTSEPPFDAETPINFNENIYVIPYAVLEIAHTGKLPSGLRNPRIINLRFNKPPEACIEQ